MKESLKVFLKGLIDYAGLFPPAQLDMKSAVETYARHLESDHSWIVGRFICPVSRLVDFADHGGNHLAGHAPIRVSALASRAADMGSITSTASGDGALVRSFEKNDWGRVDVLEVRLPEDLLDSDSKNIGQVLDNYEDALLNEGLRLERIFYEIARRSSWTRDTGLVLSVLKGVDSRGYKIRCGGVTADAYPTPQELADAIGQSVRARVPYKATAGLHHPIRHFRESAGVFQHGFVNVFGAGALAYEGVLDQNQVRALVEDQDLSQFVFGDDGLRWHDASVSAATLREARHQICISYGCCDIDEPVEDLIAANLM